MGFLVIGGLHSAHVIGVDWCGAKIAVVRAVCELCSVLKAALHMLHATLLYCAAALAAAKSRGGPSWTAAQREHFATNGYVLQPDVIRPEDRDALVAAFERLFRGDFDTGCYPDEWHWREGIIPMANTSRTISCPETTIVLRSGSRSTTPTRRPES